MAIDNKNASKKNQQPEYGLWGFEVLWSVGVTENILNPVVGEGSPIGERHLRAS